MVKLLVKIATLLVFWRPAKWRKNFKARLASSLYAIPIRRRAKKCGSYVTLKRSRRGEVWHLCSNEKCRHRVEVKQPETEEEE